MNSNTVRKPRARRSCVFRGQFIREQVDPRVQEQWKAQYGAAAPFGNLRAIWANEACARINPYIGSTCPYDEAQCAMSFLEAVETVTLVRRRSPTGYFRSVARSMGATMADEKPLARERPGDARDASAGHRSRPDDDDPGGTEALPGLHRALDRPVAIGTLLGSFNFGPRPQRGTERDGQAGTK